MLQSLRADTHYVSLDGGNVPPYTNGWASAATNIQDAINDALTVASDTMLVSNGMYQTGGTVAGSMTSRVYISKAITVRSFNNDPTNTIIKGAWASSGQTNGTDAIRCVYMVNNSSLIGFTLTNGATIAGGDGGGALAQSTSAGISNCVITICSAAGNGGGVRYATIYTSQITRNSSFGTGGGISDANVYDSQITSNSTPGGGGGSIYCTLYRSTISYNRATGAAASAQGGGAQFCNLYNCIVAYNSSVGSGGGAYGSSGGGMGKTYYNCLFYGNETTGGNGGALYIYQIAATLYNCTIAGNKSAYYGGGLRIDGIAANVINCIIYLNTSSYDSSSDNYYAGAGGTLYFTNTCTFPAKGGWNASNTTNHPLFIANGTGSGNTLAAGNYHLRPDSPCVNSGLNAAAPAPDLDGKTRIRYGTVDMGAYELLYRGTIFGLR